MVLERLRALIPWQTTFYDELRTLLPKKPLIYYPASASDDHLKTFLPDARVIHLDSDPGCPIPEEQIVADYNRSPFKDEVFDAIYYKDNHADNIGFKEMLRTLKIGGLIIFDTDTCMGKFKSTNVENHRMLEILDRPTMSYTGTFDNVIVLRKLEKPRV